ncbi:MAG: RNase adapter protein RapZ, partial [Pseudonocardiales bacterium]|nr:RNase adapter protein RapZ [Pseudonocardiales bacterium]
MSSRPEATATTTPGIEVALVSGLSGAGRSTAAKVLEDLGWFVVDNLPPEL